MPSPFPGMNPYLEHPDIWPDFHHHFIAATAELLNSQLGPGFFAKVEVQVYLHELPEAPPRLTARADTAVLQGVRGEGPGPAVAIAAPVVGRIDLAVDEVRIPALEIVDAQQRQVVAVFELLSPTNKRPGADRDQYVAKRSRLLKTGVHFVELDLLRAWPRLPVDNLPACDYVAMVSRYEMRPAVELWPIKLRERLPVIPVPLTAEHETTLDLQAAHNRAYDAGAYQRYVFELPLQPPLSDDDLAWAQNLAANTVEQNR